MTAPLISATFAMHTPEPGSVNDPLADARQVLTERHDERRETLLQRQADTLEGRKARTAHVDPHVDRTYAQLDASQVARLDAGHRRELAIVAALDRAPDGMTKSQIARDVMEPVQGFGEHTPRPDPKQEFLLQAQVQDGLSTKRAQVDAQATLDDVGGDGPVLFQRTTEPHPDIKAAKQRAIEQALGRFTTDGNQRGGQGRGGYEPE